MNLFPMFSGKHIPVETAASCINKSQIYVREGIIQGFFPVGTCFKVHGNMKFDYYISPFLFWKTTGILTIKENFFQAEYPTFSKGSIPIKDASDIMGKNIDFIREGLIQKKLPFGSAFKKPDSSKYNYYISPKLFWEYTGYAI